MQEKLSVCIEKLKKLASDVQGAPYPGVYDNELYNIWYEHVQRSALDALEFLGTEIQDKADAEIADILSAVFR